MGSHGKGGKGRGGNGSGGKGSGGKGSGGKGNGGKGGKGSDFDIALRGYDRRQVDRCLDQLTSQLDEAVSQLETVEVLQAQLCQAQVEIEQLRHYARDNVPWSERLGTIMAAAEQLWRRAAQDADAIRAHGGVADQRLETLTAAPRPE
jgi:cell division septum initiation protein DivIVA